MSPSKRIDRVFAGVGRIAISSGTDHGPTFKRINAMLTGLYKIGRIDILAMIRDGVHAPLVVLHHYERGQLDKLPSAETAGLLIPAFRSFVAKHDCGTAQRSNMQTSVRHLERLKGGASAIVADLPRLLRLLKDGMRDRPVAFNKARGHSLTFVSEIQGAHSPLWVAVAQVKRFTKVTAKRALHRRPLTVAELDAVCAAFKDHDYKSGKSVRTIEAFGLVLMTRTLAFSGMRPSEYWKRKGATWEPRMNHLWVSGTKTAAAKRPTFAFRGHVEPTCGEQFYRRAFGNATDKALGQRLDIYSLRRTFAALCESAQIEPSRAKAYLGHGPATVTDIYLKTNVLPFVASDGEKVAAWIAAERARAAAPTLKLETGR